MEPVISLIQFGIYILYLLVTVIGALASIEMNFSELVKVGQALSWDRFTKWVSLLLLSLWCIRMQFR